MSQRAALVVNVASRTGAAAADRARDLLIAAGVDLGWTRAVAPADVRRTVKEAALHGHRTIVVGGGDGTVGCAARVLSDLPATVRPALAVLPLGTANDFARTLDIPRTLEGACATVADGKVVDVDLGHANEAAFLNAASIGLSVGVAAALRPAMKRHLGPAAYPLATLGAYRRHVPFSATLSFPGGDFEPLELDDLLQLTVGNGRHYGGGNVVAPDAGIDDGMLDVHAIRRGHLGDHLSVARLLRSGSLVRHRNVQHLTTRSMLVTTDEELPVNLDGELVTSTPVLFEVERDVIDVVVPEHVTHVRRAGRLDEPRNHASADPAWRGPGATDPGRQRPPVHP